MDYEMIAMPEVVIDLIKYGLKVQPRIEDDGSMCWVLPDFHKSGTVKLRAEIPENGSLEDAQLVATARYDETTEIDNLSDIVHLNIDWAERTARKDFEDASEGLKRLSEPYKRAAIDLGILEEQVRTITTLRMK